MFLSSMRMLVFQSPLVVGGNGILPELLVYLSYTICITLKKINQKFNHLISNLGIMFHLSLSDDDLNEDANNEDFFDDEFEEDEEFEDDDEIFSDEDLDDDEIEDDFDDDMSEDDVSYFIDDDTIDDDRDDSEYFYGEYDE